MQPPRLGHVAALDGLRGIAIILVIGLHYFSFPAGGAVGVDLFFVLSGFLITTLLLEERQRNGRVRLGAFYVRRARRLFPALAVLLIVYFIATRRIEAVAAGAFYSANILMASGHSGVVIGLGRLWSLAQEEQFYLVWPVLLLLLAKSRRAAILMLLLAAALASYRAALLLGGASPNRIYYGPDTHADGLMVGAALAAARVRWSIQVGEWAGKVGLSVLIPACLFGWLTYWWAEWGQPLFEIGVALLIAAAMSDTALARALSNRPLVWVGERSYSLYLWSGTVLVGTIYVIGAGFPADLVALAAVFAIASLSYRFVEQPLRRRRIPATDGPGSPSPATAAS